MTINPNGEAIQQHCVVSVFREQRRGANFLASCWQACKNRVTLWFSSSRENDHDSGYIINFINLNILIRMKKIENTELSTSKFTFIISKNSQFRSKQVCVLLGLGEAASHFVLAALFPSLSSHRTRLRLTPWPHVWEHCNSSWLIDGKDWLSLHVPTAQSATDSMNHRGWVGSAVGRLACPETRISPENIVVWIEDQL